MRIETELRRTFWPKRGNGGLEIGFGNFAEPDGSNNLQRQYLTNRVR